VKKLVFTQSGGNKSRGAVFIEFALVMVVFTPLLLGMIDFSVAFLNKMVITNASREGVRFAVTRPDPSSLANNCEPGNLAVIAVVNSFIDESMISFGQTTSVPKVTISKPQLNGINACKVAVEYNYEGLFWFNSSTLSAETAMHL
jgi:Flp pilus assembly protein TadG